MTTSKFINYQIFPLFLSEFGKKKSLSKIITPQVSEEEILHLGSFFALLEVNARNEINSRVAQLFEDIGNNYYQTFIDDEIDPEDHLEIILQKANNKLQHIIESGNLSSKPDFLHFIMGVVKDNNLYFVQRGYFSPLLIHLPDNEKEIGGKKSRNRETEIRSKMVNILEGLKDAPRKEQYTKAFSHIISGKINPGDYLFFCNENILDNISSSKIKKTIVTLPPKSALEHLKNLLLEINNSSLSFLGLLVKFAAHPQSEKTLESVLRKSPAESMSKLMSLREKTDKLLTPAIIPNFKKIISGLKSTLKKFDSLKLPKIKPPACEEKIKSEPGSTKSPKLKLPEPLVKFYKLISKKNGLGEIHQKIKEKGRGRLSRTKHWLKGLSPSSRNLFLIALSFILLFVVSLGVIYARKQNEERKAEIENIILSIEEKQDSAEAKIIIGDDEKAKELLSQAEELLIQIPENKKGFEEKVLELESKISKQRNKIYHIVEIEDPHLVYNFVNLGAEVRVDEIIILRKKLYALKRGQNLVWEYSLDDKKIRELQLSELTEGNLSYALKKNDDAIYFYLDNEKLSEYSTVAEKIKMVDFSVIENVHGQNLIEYSDNLYLLDTANNQIWRYVAIEDGFGSPRGWFKEEVSLVNADSLAIDGEVYILENNGQIKKFFKGKTSEFIQEKIEPEISEGSNLYTNQDSDYLYFLTPQKLIVLDKTGKVKTQYTSPKFSNLKDFVINEADKKIYILTENSVYSFAAEHL